MDTNDNPADRRTMTTDPKAPGGAIVETGKKDGDGNRVTVAGSRFLTTNIDGQWFVCNTRGEPLDINKPFSTEGAAMNEAAQLEITTPPPQNADGQ